MQINGWRIAHAFAGRPVHCQANGTAEANVFIVEGSEFLPLTTSATLAVAIKSPLTTECLTPRGRVLVESNVTMVYLLPLGDIAQSNELTNAIAGYKDCIWAT